MAYSVIITFDQLRSLAYTGLSSSYAPVGSQIIHAIRIFKILNTTDVEIIYSIDGVNDNDAVPANSGFVADIAANQTSTAGGGFLTAGIQVYAKTSGTPSKGNVYVTILYGKGN